MEKDERKLLAAAGCNVAERVFTAEEVHTHKLLGNAISLPLSPSLFTALWEVDNRT